jgi:hypothetical protein
LGRDPVEETGGLNLFGFVTNNPINHWDLLGMTNPNSSNLPYYGVGQYGLGHYDTPVPTRAQPVWDRVGDPSFEWSLYEEHLADLRQWEMENEALFRPPSTMDFSNTVVYGDGRLGGLDAGGAPIMMRRYYVSSPVQYRFHGDFVSAFDPETRQRWVAVPERGLQDMTGLFVGGAQTFFVRPRPAVPPVTGVPITANYAQSWFRQTFSKDGAEALKKISGQNIETIDDLVRAIESKTVDPSKIPVNYVRRGEDVLIHNTRTAHALERAGVPRELWNGIDRTGDELFERLVSEQLRRNQLPHPGTPIAFPKP